MAEPNNDDFLDSLEEAMAEEFSENDAEIDDEALELDDSKPSTFYHG